MDAGCFYRGGSSITSTSLLSDSFNTSSPYTSTPTAGSSSLFSDTPLDLCGGGPSIHHKMDQLLFLFNEERRETAGLKAAVLELKGQVDEIKDSQEKHMATSEPFPVAAPKGSYKLPPDVSVSA